MRLLLEIVAGVAAGSVAALGFGIVVYVFGSFALMRSHTAERSLEAWMRELARELFLAGISQPFLPLFYVVGRRMGASSTSRPRADRTGMVPIVFVHGYMQNRIGFYALSRALSRRGLGPMFGFNYPWFATIASNAKRLERFLAHVCDETGSSTVDVVCHSMGGLIAIEMMRGELAAEKRNLVRRFVTIATPHAGVMWRGPMIGFGATNMRRGSKLLEAYAAQTLSVPALSIFSTHDNVVHPKESSSLAKRGGTDVEVEGLGHLSILFSPAVADHVATFLSQGALEREGSPLQAAERV